ncbi:MAG: hypothetical protein ABI806_09155 [Candidatus Solibacter sp.]
MIVFLLLLAAMPLAAQDVFSSGDAKPAQRENPCLVSNPNGNCKTFYYDPDAQNGLKDATAQCFAYTKTCKCDCWTMPNAKPAPTPLKPQAPITLPGGISTGATPRPNTPGWTPVPPGEVFGSGPGYMSPRPPPGQKILPGEVGPGIRAAVQAGKCKTALHNQRDIYLNCPGYVPDLVNDRLQPDPNAPDPAPSPIKLYGTISTSDQPPDGASDKGNGNGSRFGVGNINDADPPLLVTAKMMEGIDDCLKENLRSDIAMLPLTYAAQRYRGLKSIMTAYGVLGNANSVVADINKTLAPGQSLGDRSYEIGRLLCEGYSLGDALHPKGGDAGGEGPALDPIRPVNRPAIARPAGPKPTPAYRDPTVKSALERGITLEDHKALNGIAQANGWNIAVRDSNPYAMRWIGHPDAVAKPVDVKAKTLKPPTAQQLAKMSPAEKAAEAAKAPYYGLATAQGMTSGELSLLRLKQYKVDDPTKGYLLRTPEGKVMYSDIDIHGIYDKAGNDVWPKTPEGEKALIDGLNGSTLERMFQHGPQDVYPRRNDPTGPSFGPQPPVTIYTADGRTLFIDSIPKLEAAYREMGVDWNTIYPLPAARYAR